MVGVHDQEHVERLGKVGVDAILFAGHSKHHLKKVFAVREIVSRIDERLADRLLVAISRNRGQLCHEPVNAHFHLPRIANVERILIEGGKRADNTAQRGHWVGIAGKTAVETAHILVDHRVVRERLPKAVELIEGRELAVDQEVAHLHKIALLSQHLDGVATVPQDPLFAV